MKQQDIFNMFGNNIPESLKAPKAKEVDKKEKKSTTENKDETSKKGKSSSKSNSTVIETFPITVAYAREQEIFSREDFEKEGDITLEDLRKKMMLDYPEFSSSKNVKMDYNKSKNLIIPAITGGKLG